MIRIIKNIVEKPYKTVLHTIKYSTLVLISILGVLSESTIIYFLTYTFIFVSVLIWHTNNDIINHTLTTIQLVKILLISSMMALIGPFFLESS